MENLGIILAGGKSSRLYPATQAVSKQLLPIYDKPLVFYPLTTLMLMGIRDILLIVNPHEKYAFEKLFEFATLHMGINVQIITQEKPNGIAEAFILAQQATNYKKYDRFTLILGDNLFHGASFSGEIKDRSGAVIYGQKVADLNRFGVISIDKKKGRIVKIVEKPKKIDEKLHNYAITGLYSFPKDVIKRAEKLKPSDRGELEVTDLINKYFDDDLLNPTILKRGVSWFDTGTPDSLLDAAHYVKTIQTNQDFLVGSPHEVAFKNKWVTDTDALSYLKTVKQSIYGKMLEEVFYNG